MIEVKNICKSFGDRLIIDDISIKFEQGKPNLVIGQSGSGKTVLLKCIVGLFNVDSGQIFYGKDNFTNIDFAAKKEIRKQIGMLFQGGALFDSNTVEENVRFPLDMFSHMSAAEKTDRVNFCLDRVRLENVNKLFPGEISGGMKKRVAIARAIALNPRYLLCDEPNSGLDPQTSQVIDNLIKEITEEYNMTTIINTHDMNSVMEIGEMVVYIYNGKNIWQGTKDNIFHADNEYLNDFVFASPLSKRLRKLVNK